MRSPPRGPQPAAAAAGPARGWALVAGVAAVFVALFLVTMLLFGRFDRASQGRTLTTMFARYGPQERARAASHRRSTRAVVATVAVGAMTRVMPTGSHDRLARRLDLAGSARKPAEWAVLGACLAVGVAATLSLVTSYVFIGVLGGAVIGWLAMRMSLSIRILRRRATFSDQLPDMLQLIASTLQAGFSLPQALDAVIRQENQPAAGEFSRALAEARIGADLDVALEAVANRMDSDDMRWTVMAIRIQQGVGGNLAEVLLTIADTIRERAYLRRQVACAQRRGPAVRLHPRGAPAGGRDVAVRQQRGPTCGRSTRPRWASSCSAIAAALLIVGTFWMHRTIKVEV